MFYIGNEGVVSISGQEEKAGGICAPARLWGSVGQARTGIGGTGLNAGSAGLRAHQTLMPRAQARPSEPFGAYCDRPHRGRRPRHSATSRSRASE